MDITLLALLLSFFGVFLAVSVHKENFVFGLFASTVLFLIAGNMFLTGILIPTGKITARTDNVTGNVTDISINETVTYSDATETLAIPYTVPVLIICFALYLFYINTLNMRSDKKK